MSALIQLHPEDNVVVCCRDVIAGETIAVGGVTITCVEAVELGHKLALTALAAGDKVIKYGAPIGSMTAAASAGSWVHMHNMKSDYIAAHTRDAT